MTTTIDLNQYINDHTNTLTSKCAGKRMSRVCDLDGILKTDDLKMIVPNTVQAVTASFFEGLFENAIKKLGRDCFYRNVYVQSESNFSRSLDEAIARVLRQQDHPKCNAYISAEAAMNALACSDTTRQSGWHTIEFKFYVDDAGRCSNYTLLNNEFKNEK
jgi:hypothetical protein